MNTLFSNHKRRLPNPSRILGGEMRDSMTALEISDTDQFGEKKKEKKNKQKSVIGVCDNNQST